MKDNSQISSYPKQLGCSVDIRTATNEWFGLSEGMLHCTALNNMACTTLHWTRMYWTVQHAHAHCTSHQCTESHWKELQGTARHCKTLHFIALRCFVAMDCTAPNCTKLQYKCNMHLATQKLPTKLPSTMFTDLKIQINTKRVVSFALPWKREATQIIINYTAKPLS